MDKKIIDTIPLFQYESAVKALKLLRISQEQNEGLKEELKEAYIEINRLRKNRNIY